MTFTQLEYIISLNIHKQFSLAAEKCYVTQPTLSMQIQKLEDELGVKIFDRTKQPVTVTQAGQEVIAYARKIIAERDELLQSISDKKDIVNGELRVGIIPTLAPYLLPLFIPLFTKKYPKIKLVFNEVTTDLLVRDLKEGALDAGILVTPLYDKGIREDVLFYEELMVYTSKKSDLIGKEYILSKDINPDKLWLLEEGHCFRSQVMNFCELRKNSLHGSLFEYEAGSLETLIRLVDVTDGVTFLPELATLNLGVKQLRQLKLFKAPKPMREVSLVTNTDFVKKKLVNLLKHELLQSLPEKIKENKSKNIVAI